MQLSEISFSKQFQILSSDFGLYSFEITEKYTQICNLCPLFEEKKKEKEIFELVHHSKASWFIVR